MGVAAILKKGETFIGLLLVAGLFLLASVSHSPKPEMPPDELILVASTPGDQLIKSQLQIDPSTTIDFIRWELSLKPFSKDTGSFSLNINYGVNQPNTTDFVQGGEKRMLVGKFSATRTGPGKVEICRLTTGGKPLVSMTKLTDNVYHLLTDKNELMVGNGGWSYTLNRKSPVLTNPSDVHSDGAGSIMDGGSGEAIFDGRTPFSELATALDWGVDKSYIKIKWRITLNYDPLKKQPTTYFIRKILGESPINLTGKWTMIRDGDHAILKLEQPAPEKSILLLAGDGNVLFFLDQEKRLLTGNKDFSYTLNLKN